MKTLTPYNKFVQHQFKNVHNNPCSKDVFQWPANCMKIIGKKWTELKKNKTYQVTDFMSFLPNIKYKIHIDNIATSNSQNCQAYFSRYNSPNAIFKWVDCKKGNTISEFTILLSDFSSSIVEIFIIESDEKRIFQNTVQQYMVELKKLRRNTTNTQIQENIDSLSSALNQLLQQINTTHKTVLLNTLTHIMQNMEQIQSTISLESSDNKRPILELINQYSVVLLELRNQTTEQTLLNRIHILDNNLKKIERQINTTTTTVLEQKLSNIVTEMEQLQSDIKISPRLPTIGAYNVWYLKLDNRIKELRNTNPNTDEKKARVQLQIRELEKDLNILRVEFDKVKNVNAQYVEYNLIRRLEQNYPNLK